VTFRQRTLSWRECTAILIAVAVVAGLGAVFGHYDCHHVQANVTSPEPGTPRENYCSAVDAGSGFLMFGVPVLAAAVGFGLVRRTGHRIFVVAGVAVGVAIVNALVIMFLTPEYTI
jgi:hypothetical protein